MATIKLYTDLEQSKKLAEFLPIQSSDGHWYNGSLGLGFSKEAKDFYDTTKNQYIPAWSLAALIDALPEGTTLLKATNILSVGDIKYHCNYSKLNIDKWFNNPVDACVDMIIRLHEPNLL